MILRTGNSSKIFRVCLKLQELLQFLAGKTKLYSYTARSSQCRKCCNSCETFFETFYDSNYLFLSRPLSRISGPLLDRIDIHIEVTPVSFEELASRRRTSEKSVSVRERVINAREIQSERFKNNPGVYCNAQMPGNRIKDICAINEAGTQLLKTAMQKMNLSARAYGRILKVSRTIADLANSEDIKTEHLAEAIHYRSLDRENWGG